jgi:hypothetical protein
MDSQTFTRIADTLFVLRCTSYISAPNLTDIRSTYLSPLSLSGPFCCLRAPPLPSTPHSLVLLSSQSRPIHLKDSLATLCFSHRFSPTPPALVLMVCVFFIRTLHYANQTSNTYNVLDLGDDIPISVITVILRKFHQ